MAGEYIGNDGITDTEEDGQCCMTILELVITKHSHIRHGKIAFKHRAMREDLLDCCSHKYRARVAA